MFAVLAAAVATGFARFGERGAGAVGLDSVGRELDEHVKRLGVGAPNGPRRVHLTDLDVLDHLSSEVLEAAKERPGAEEPAKASVAEGGECVRNRGAH